jgi:hypothetical protein
MKTMVAFTMAVATLVLATAAPAGVQGQRCKGGVQRQRGATWVRAGTPCLILPFYGMGNFSWEITERPHNGTAVLRSDASIYYSPKPGFTGRDHMQVRLTNCDLREVSCFLGVTYNIFVE